MTNIFELVGFLATIAALGAATHCLHHRQVKLGRSVGCAAVTRLRAAEEVEVEVVVAEAGRAHVDGGGSGYMYWMCRLVVDGVGSDCGLWCCVDVGVL